jgi:hypothetical protein
MKRLVLLLALILLAVPVFAQDGGGGDSGFGGLFGMGDAPRSTNNAPPPDRLVQLRKILAEANTPLTKDQENSLSKMLESDIKKDTSELEKKYPEEVAQARAASAAAGNRGGRGGGGFGGRNGGAPPDGFQGRGDRGGAPGAEGAQARGGGRGRGPGLPPNSPLLAEMNRMNKELQDKVTASLKPEQQAALKKYQDDQIKKAGGFGALKLTLQQAGAPLTAEQETQIQGFYSDEAQQRQQLMRESMGQPDKAKLDSLTNGTMLKIVKVLNADQKKLFLESLKKQQQQ